MTLPLDPLAAVERACVAEEVASVARHDLRNRLASIRNASFYLMRKVKKTELWEADARVPQFFGLIEESVVGADDIVEQRLQLAALHPRAPAQMSLRACVERALACARVGGGVRFDLDVQDVQVEADADELALAVRCLLENAAEASPQGAAVRVVSGASTAAPISRGSDAGELQPAAHELRVIDGGAGIPEAARQDVTRAFFGDKPGHAGLGLTMAARIVRRYGGEITFGGAPGSAEVALTLPLAGQTSRNEEAR
jgi:signal transduction histidine kinase